MEIKQNNEQHSGQGFWLDSAHYQQVVGLPVISSLRNVTANIIQSKLNSSPIRVLSLGIGTGALYKDYFHRELSDNSLSLFGIDILESMISKCKVDLPFPNVNLKTGDICDFPKLFHGEYDVIEAGLVLHHILRKEELGELIQSASACLKPKGLFILGDIDVACGEYLDKKLRALENVHGKLSIDENTGTFFNEQVSLPIFSSDDQTDLEILKGLEELTCKPLMAEVENLNDSVREKLKPIIEMNVKSAKKGLEWHRALTSEDGWISLFQQNFASPNKLKIFEPTEIRDAFPGVLDNPFVLVAEKLS
jgi:SAM-dependent methyltransferase